MDATSLDHSLSLNCVKFGASWNFQKRVFFSDNDATTISSLLKKGCVECKKRDFLIITNKTTEEDGEEIITYDHICKNCHHIIPRHEYTFSVVDDYQEYTMLCMLRGRAEDSIRVLPDDPHLMTRLFWHI
ncbi:hypothetical protein JRQ81_010913 [Phrynocephalus forsythii]|uniref:Protein Churchill n=1 Tax=Phrynocephalus forsythii TaxID=171643 RepID=A0A9Q1AR78_9SAUR|nr:hypothetical protein JRQ81_010913 [Phrynocephalus forsythii]